MDSCLTLGNELSEETHVPTKQETLLGKGAWTETRGQGSPAEVLGHVPRGPGSYGGGITFQVVSGRSLLAQGPSWRLTHRSARMDSSEEDPGRLVG